MIFTTLQIKSPGQVSCIFFIKQTCFKLSQLDAHGTGSVGAVSQLSTRAVLIHFYSSELYLSLRPAHCTDSKSGPQAAIAARQVRKTESKSRKWVSVPSCQA